MKTIEEVEKERDEILAKALRLAELLKKVVDLNEDELLDIAAIEALRPKPKPREVWARYGSNGVFISAFATKAGAEMTPMQCSAIHMREVLPAPKWERWFHKNRVIFDGNKQHLGNVDSDAQAERLVNAHNTEMECLAALWEGGEG